MIPKFVFFALLLMLVACTELTAEQDSFKKLCLENKGMWMEMKPMKQGEFMAEQESCLGCMPDAENHICNQQEYTEFLSEKAS